MSTSTSTTPLAIDVRAVRRVYKARPKPIVALDGVDLQVEPGELFGLLGPNGAGKTTLIKILTTLLLPTEGSAKVFGFDVARQTSEIRRIMNIVSGGETSGYGLLQVREQLWMFSQFYGLPSREGWKRVDELMDAVGIQDLAQQKINGLSTGQRQKMNFARGLLNDPWIFFLDEPTLGLDVSAARAVRELIRDWQAAVPGRTILLTSHYMAEVEELCERLAIVDRGRILAIGSPAELRQRVQSESIFVLEVDRLEGGPGALARLPGVVKALISTDADAGAPGDRQTVEVKLVLAEDAALGGVVSALAGLNSHIVALRKSEPSLEDVFVELVGRGFSDAVADETPDDTPNDRGTPPRPPDRAEALGGEPATVDEEPREPVAFTR
ncbi:MAG: type transport system ATP-binding protein [Chloroflexota bacterium]|jgi:ABC-2 type transport system ATP-binding protein|nr:type transport system ATP-binding protein [Chloroflexota bacterium]